MRYRPVVSVTVERIASISAGLLAATVTPAIDAPDESVTDPAMTAWPSATVGRPVIETRSASVFNLPFTCRPDCKVDDSIGLSCICHYYRSATGTNASSQPFVRL